MLDLRNFRPLLEAYTCRSTSPSLLPVALAGALDNGAGECLYALQDTFVPKIASSEDAISYSVSLKGVAPKYRLADDRE